MDQSEIQDKPPAHPLLNPDNPQSISSLFGERSWVTEAIKRVVQGPNAHLLDLSEKVLKREIQERYSHRLTETDHRIRMKFWHEYDVSQSLGKKITISGVCSGVMHERALFLYLSKDEHVAWMLCPPVNYSVFLDEGLQFGLDRLRSYLDIDPMDPVTGKLNTKIMEIQMKITAMLDLRKHGAFTQKIEQKNLNVSMEARDYPLIQEQSLQDIQERIKYLEKRPVDVIDV